MGTCCCSSLGFCLISFVKHLLHLVGPQVVAELQVASQQLTLHLAWVLGALGSGCEVWYFYWPLREAMPFLKRVA